MGRYLKNYMKKIESSLEDENSDFEYLRKEHLVQIEFLQHERFIHLVVTCLIAILTVMCIIGVVITSEISLIAMTILLLGLLVPYIAYYYWLENNVQKLYDIYNKLEEKTR